MKTKTSHPRTSIVILGFVDTTNGVIVRTRKTFDFEHFTKRNVYYLLPSLDSRILDNLCVSTFIKENNMRGVLFSFDIFKFCTSPIPVSSSFVSEFLRNRVFHTF